MLHATKLQAKIVTSAYHHHPIPDSLQLSTLPCVMLLNRRGKQGQEVAVTSLT